MNNSERLYAAILQRDFTAADNMTAAGASLDGDIREALVNGPSGAVNFVITRYNYFKQFMDFAAHSSNEDFAAVSEKLFALLGEPIYNNIGEYRYSHAFVGRFFEPLFFETLLKYYSGKRMRKQQTMEEIIDRNSPQLLEICARYGWLKTPRIRDAVIEYSQKRGSAECTAWLLDFKNRNFDLAAERAKAEKKLERELNANPNSLSEIKKIWRFSKLKDGTLEITCYKGSQSEVAVPEKIGGNTVTAIGAGAFTGAYYFAKRTAREICERRAEAITKITLPETITAIGENAFYDCHMLREVNIPNGVKVINRIIIRTAVENLELPETVEKIADYAFARCIFKEIKLPQNLAEIGKSAFQMCENLTEIEIPENVKVVRQGTFWKCERLKNVTLAEGVEEIKARAFWECPALETITLPASIKKIENFKRDGKTRHPFTDSPKLTATVTRGSYAEKYCKKNGIAYKYKED